MSPLIKELGYKSGISFIGNIIGHVLSMLYLLLVVRFLGAEVYGSVIYIMSSLSILSAISQFGLDNTLVSYLSRDTIDGNKKRQLVSFSLWLSFFSSIIFIFFCFVNREFISYKFLNLSSYDIFVAVLPVLFFDTWMKLLLEAIRSQRLIAENVFASFILLPGLRIFFFLLACACWQDRDYWLYLWPIYLAETAIIAYAMQVLHRRGLLSFALGISPAFARQVISFSFAVLLTSIVSVIMGNIDKYMIGYMGNPADVGIYNVALVFGGVSSFALSAINSIFAPMISSLYFQNNMDSLRMVYCKATKWVTIVNFFVLGIIIVFAADIMHIAGDSFLIGAKALLLVALGQMVNSAVGSVGYMNVMTGHPRYNMYANIAAVIFNVAGNWCLIPRYGIDGAALATAGALALHNILNFLLMQTYLPMNPFQRKYLGMLAALVIAIGCTFFYANIVADSYYLLRLSSGSAIFAMVFFIVIYRTAMEEDEKEAFSKIIRFCKSPAGINGTGQGE